MMPEPQTNNDELQNYEIPITDLTSDGNNPILSPSTGADVITAVGGVTPERFWMVFKSKHIKKCVHQVHDAALLRLL